MKKVFNLLFEWGGNNTQPQQTPEQQAAVAEINRCADSIKKIIKEYGIKVTPEKIDALVEKAANPTVTLERLTAIQDALKKSYDLANTKASKLGSILDTTLDEIIKSDEILEEALKETFRRSL